nr:uncharacterized protein LOC122271241 [Parasteatoda tepidariorum]
MLQATSGDRTPFFQHDSSMPLNTGPLCLFDFLSGMVEVLREKFSFQEIEDSFSKEHFDTFHDEKEIETKWYEAYEKCILLAMLLIGSIGVSSRATDAYLYSIYSVAIFFWIVLGIAYFDTYLELGSYTAGVFILDKLDGKRGKRKAARDDASNLYNLVADLNWKLAKYCPREFTKHRVYQKFLDIYVDNPEQITAELMQELHQTSQELKAISGDKLLQFHLSEVKSLFEEDDDEARSESVFARELKSQTERGRSARMTLSPSGKLHHIPLSLLTADKRLNKELPETESASSSLSDRSRIETLLEKREVSSEVSGAGVEEENEEDRCEETLDADSNASKELSDTECASPSLSDRSTVETSEKEGEVLKRSKSSEAEVKSGEDRNEKLQVADRNSSKELDEFASSGHYDKRTIESSSRKGEVSIKTSIAEAEEEYDEERNEKMRAVDSNTSDELPTIEHASSRSSDRSSIEDAEEKGEVLKNSPSAEVEEEQKENQSKHNKECD